MRPLFLSPLQALLLIVLCVVAPLGRAAVTLENVAVGTTNPSMVLLDALAEEEPAGSIHGAVAVQLYNSAAFFSSSLEVEATCELLDLAGVAAPLTTDPVTTQWVLTDTFNVSAGAHQVFSLPFDVRPAALDANQRYRVSTTIRVRVPGAPLWTSIPGTFRETPRRQWVQFTNVTVEDVPLNVKILTGTPSVAATTVLRNVPGQETFTLHVPTTAYRYDLTTGPADAANVAVTYHLSLRDTATNLLVPVVQPDVTVIKSMGATNGTGASLSTWTQALPFAPMDWSTLDPTVDYACEVEVTYEDADASVVPAVPVLESSSAQRLLGLSGVLKFGGVVTTFTMLGNDPTVGMAASPGGGFTTQLAVAGQSGSAAGLPGRSYGDGVALAVNYDPASGDALVLSGSQAFSTENTDIAMVGTMRFIRLTMQLTSDGAVLDAGGLFLPAGCGLTTRQNARRHLPYLLLSHVPLAADFSLPFATYNFTPPGGADFFYVVVDRLPVRWRASSIEWDLAASTLQFTQVPSSDPADPPGPVLTRLFQEQALAGLTPLLADPSAADRPANDAYLGQIVDQTPVTIGMGASGSAMLSVAMDFGPGSLTSHFPLGVVATWTDGRFRLEENQIVSPSYLNSAGPTPINYARDCTGGCGTNAGAGNFSFQPTNDRWKFTADGGLQADGALAPQTLEWGSTELASGPQPPGTVFAHRTNEWTTGAVHIAGVWLAESSAATEMSQRAATMLLSGVKTDGSFERPLEPSYFEGLANYAGLNLRLASPGQQSARSVLAGVETPAYDLKARAKFYVRESGVTGIHEAVALSPSNLQMYGFDVNLDGLRLAFRDGLNVESKTGGSVHVPDPVQSAGFDLEFAELQFLCRGQPGKCSLATGGSAKTLAYWGTDIIPQAMEFKQPVNPSGCASVTDGFILLGVQTKFPAVSPQSIHASLGFDKFGNLVTKASPLAAGLEIDSRFTLPASMQIAGGGDVPWEVTIIGQGYLNNPLPNPTPPGYQQPESGFLTFPATMNVPWFEDMKVQLQVSASATATNASIFHIMGGWPANPADGMGAGWQMSGQSYFTNKKFDPDHWAFPSDMNVTDYRNPGTDAFNPRAQKRWLGVVDFDFPLVWEPVQRRFHSNSQVDKLVVLGSVDRQVKSLSPSTAEITFGAQLEIPRLNAATLAAAAKEQLSATVANALQQALGGPLTAQLTNGMQQLDGLLTERLTSALEAPLNDAVDPLAQAVVDTLAAGQTAAAHATELKNTLRALPALGLLSDLDARLVAGENALQAVISLLAAAPDGSRNIVRNLVLRLVRDSGIPGADALGDAAITAVLNEVMPAIDLDLAQAESVLIRVKNLLTSARTNIVSQITAVFNDATATLQGVAATAAAEMDSALGSSEARALLSAPAQKDKIKRIIVEKIMASTVVPRFQTIVRQHLQDLQQSFRASLDDVLGQVNHLVRSVIERTIDDAVSGITETEHPAEGGMGPTSGGSGKLAAVNLEGYAQINDESLRVLDINGKFEFNVPDSMKVQAHLRIEEFDANTPATGCRPAGSAFAVVSVDANAECDWIGSSGTTVGVGAKFSLQDGLPVGFDGYFDLKGEVALGPVIVNEARLLAGFGATNGPGGTAWAYIGAKVRGRLNAYEAAVGMFMGRCCTVEPIAMIDPQVAQALAKSNVNPNKPITGVYLYGEAWIPLNEVFGIPSTCLFTVKAGAGAGFFAFVGDDLATFIGCKQFFGVEGTFLCIFSIRGEMTILGAVSTPGSPPAGAGPNDGLFARAQGPPPAGAAFILYGNGKFSAQLGACPFCLKVSKQVGLTWSIGGPDPGMDIDF